MIDLHNHILPNVDDGAADLGESLEIARQFAAEGVTLVAATPHFNAMERWDREDLAVRQRVDEIQRAIDEQEISIRVVPGNEIFISPDVPDLLNHGAALTLGDSNAVLVECSFDQRPLYLDETLFQLQLAGYQPVLAHPERYGFVQRDLSALDNLMNRGIVMQLTAPSLLGEYGGPIRRVAETLLRKGIYACAASDRHHPGPMRSLQSLHALLVECGDATLADLLLSVNPDRLLHGQHVEAPAPLLSEQKKSMFSRLFSRRPGELADEELR